MNSRRKAIILEHGIPAGRLAEVSTGGWSFTYLLNPPHAGRCPECVGSQNRKLFPIRSRKGRLSGCFGGTMLAVVRLKLPTRLATRD